MTERSDRAPARPEARRRTVALAAIVLAFSASVSPGVNPQWTELLAMQKRCRSLNAEIGRAPEADRAALQSQQRELQAKIEAKGIAIVGTNWVRHVAQTVGPHKDRAGNPAELTTKLWVPSDCANVRGLFITFWSMLVADTYVRAACREAGMAIVRFEGLDGGFNYTGSAPAALEAGLAAIAKESNHPEVRTAPFLTAGMSASVIGARNVAYWRPDRSLGVVHAAGGNMHHARYDPKTSLAGVPFLAINGEMEACGPEGGGHMSGAAGIRPEYGFQTQWVMIRDSLIERRIQDPSHFMNLLVLANAGHGSWSDETAYLCGLFILKAAQYRAPPGPPDPDAIRPCVALKPESGWLTDANLKAPQFAPAPYGKYEGDPGRAFWHFDEELARATVEYHTGVFTRPDPAWGPLDIEAVRAFNLARVQGGEAAYKALLPLCEATDDTRRADAAGYLSRLGPASLPAIPRLIEMFGERPVPKVGEAVARALARLAPDSTPPLLAAMKHADGFVRAGALTALCNIGQPADTIVAAAEAAAADPSPAVHRAALDTLIALRAPPARIGVTAAAVLDDLAAAGQPLAFTNTLVLAMQFGPASLAAVTPALIRALGNPDLSIFRTAAAGILAVRPKPPREAIPAFVAAVRTPDTNRWSIAVEAIGRLDGYGDTNLTVACIGHLQATNDAVADQAASILVRTAAKSGTPVFRARMAGFLAGIVDGNGSTALRRRAARAIGGFGADAKGAIPVLEMAAEEPGMRDAARAAIVDIRAGTGPSLDADGL